MFVKRSRLRWVGHIAETETNGNVSRVLTVNGSASCHLKNKSRWKIILTWNLRK
jgi:hypothetical protein